MVDSNPPEDLGDGPIPMANIGGRRFINFFCFHAPFLMYLCIFYRYLAIRGCSEDLKGRSAREQQERVVREVWKKTERFDYQRPL